MAYQPQGYNNPGYNQQQQYQQYPYPPPNQNAPYNQNVEGGLPKNEVGFTVASVRAAFVRKVFLLVSIMLGVVTIMTAIPFINTGTQEFVTRTTAGTGLYFASYFTFIIVYIVLICCDDVRRSFPSNLICLGILTLSIGYMTMMITAFHSTESVLLCLIITTIACSGIVLFSMQTKYDLTNMVGLLALAGLVIMIYGLVAVIALSFFKVRFLYTIYAGLAALLFMGYLAMDIQMLMGGRKYEISPEEHIFAAIQIFLDIVYIFWMLLMLFGDRHN